MRIATFNVNGVNGRLPVLLRWLSETAPDVVCLQELKASQEKFPEAAIRGAGYGVIWHGQKSWNGVAILARGMDPIETRRGLPGNRMTRRAGISKQPSAGWQSDASIYQTATQPPAQNSITSCAGSNG